MELNLFLIKFGKYILVKNFGDAPHLKKKKKKNTINKNKYSLLNK